MAVARSARGVDVEAIPYEEVSTPEEEVLFRFTKKLNINATATGCSRCLADGPG